MKYHFHIFNGTKTCFEEEAKGNSEMAYFVVVLTVINKLNDFRVPRDL